MKVTGTGGLAQPAGAASRPAVSSEGFSVGGAPASASTATPARVGGAAPVASTDALLALQEVEGPLERRRRAVRRAGRLLDALDDVKLALLDGESGAPALQRLAQAVREHRAGAEDPELEGLLDQIDTRAAVELAKAEMSRLAA